MINFKSYLIEEEKTVHFTFGKMNPPNSDHGVLLDEMSRVSGDNTSRVYLTQSFDPLGYTEKVKHSRKMFPKHARDIMVNKGVSNIKDAMTTLYNEGFRCVVLHTSKVHLNEYSILLNKYNGVKGNHGLYNFKNIKVVESIKDDPDASVTLIESATSNNYNTFHQHVPSNMSNQNARALFNDIRVAVGLSEEKEYKNHVQLKPVSELREAFVNQKLFDIGEEVFLNKKDVVGIIESIGPNYLVVESKGESFRCWIEDVSKVETKEAADDPCWKDYKQVGMKKKNGKQVPNCVPENLGKKSKLAKNSKGQKKVLKTLRSMTTEDAVANAKKKIDREKVTDAKKHDRMLDIARLKKIYKKNTATK
tara:strand:+ start:44659 stop:45747 length:1089 start_codon:yes stop_codon:yes gene_type:complete